MAYANVSVPVVALGGNPEICGAAMVNPKHCAARAMIDESAVGGDTIVTVLGVDLAPSEDTLEMKVVVVNAEGSRNDDDCGIIVASFRMLTEVRLREKAIIGRTRHVLPTPTQVCRWRAKLISRLGIERAVREKSDSRLQPIARRSRAVFAWCTAEK